MQNIRVSVESLSKFFVSDHAQTPTRIDRVVLTAATANVQLQHRSAANDELLSPSTGCILSWPPLTLSLQAH